MGRITEITRDMDGGLALTAEFEAEKIFWSPEWTVETNKEFLIKAENDLNKNLNKADYWKPSITNPDMYEFEFKYVYDALGLPVRKNGRWTVSKYEIRDIYFNAGKNTTVIVWATGHKTKVKLADGENCFINNAVAAAVMKRKYRSNSAFKAHVDRVLGGYSDSAYLVLARAETSQIYGSYDIFDKLVKEKLILSSSK